MNSYKIVPYCARFSVATLSNDKMCPQPVNECWVPALHDVTEG